MNKARSALILSLGDKVLREVSKEKSTAAIWLKLENLYMTKTLANRLYLKQRLYTLKMHLGASIADHIDEFNRLILDLENIDVKLEDEDQALLLIQSLTSSYDVLADTLIYGREAISLEEVHAALMAKELSKKSEEKEHSAGGESLMIRGRIEKKEGKGKNRSRSKSKTKFKCFICHKEGHFKKNFPEKKGKKHYHSEDSGDASVASDGYDSSELLVASNTQVETDWVMDSGCSSHMCPNRNWFCEYNSIEGGQVLMGNNATCKVVGIGSIKIRLEDGTEKIMTKVRHVPELKRSLISLGTLKDAGYCFKAEKSMLKILKGSRVVMKGERTKNCLYVLKGVTITGEASVAGKNDGKASTLWHQRLGHISDRGLQELGKQGLLGNDKLEGLDFCKHCIYGKHTRVKFTTRIHKTKEKLGYIHSDLWGPARTSTHGGNPE